MIKFNQFSFDNDQIVREITELIPRIDRLPKKFLTAKEYTFKLESPWSINTAKMILPIKGSEKRELTLADITSLISELKLKKEVGENDVMEIKMNVEQLKKLVKKGGTKHCCCPVIVIDNSYDTNDIILYRNSICCVVDQSIIFHDFNCWIYDKKTQTKKYYQDVEDFMNAAKLAY
ncbi:hypothetical protein LMB49_10675 [Limosilactobacillus reuteri]|uniref:hypothetical protein n=1 Tax=Limosilactobacillus reuteri TaxID=1598 RepID=UPI001E5E9909|nr:hypothetical protein [Limosilactobacillus reuteri]MCC4370575.1 hypothetical protein [Limosilactobacillus reuteri]MCC4371856.1 hypothetical protein [Limosilactobacillus reuteri]MCC4509328.1 hypothetical protein [Limosilactobacillus reuteri]MCC4509371.1 hypothetical protein [Limosilactobacillus reuteri]